MLASFLSFIISCLITILVLRYRYKHERLTSDFDFDGPQKFHKVAVPRIGGLGVFIGALIGALVRLTQDVGSGLILLQIVACGFTAYTVGTLEDLTKKVSPRLRILGCLISALTAYLFLGTQVKSVDILWTEPIFNIPIFVAFVSCFMIVGLTNAYNIIDGFNGLVCMVAIITLSAIAYVAFRNNDSAIVFVVVALIASIFGFFIWNYPKGLIFLGDGGAYFIGFSIGVISILLTVRNSSVSPWFAFLINIYPIFETLFSIWRKKFIKKMSPSMPDGVHLHMLIYGRIAKWVNPGNKNSYFSSNARTSPFLWFLSSLAVFPAVIFWNNTLILQLASLIFCLSYIYIYRAIVKFKIQWLIKP
jgi:UDP-N-acetylmuramyl pentapeptide phosphotransferase/UDP-N-acetylglucosamine-1-phosphate transferase